MNNPYRKDSWSIKMVALHPRLLIRFLALSLLSFHLPTILGNESPHLQTTSNVVDVCSQSLPQLLSVNPDRSLLLHCSTFDIRAIESSNETIVKARVTTGNLNYFQVTGMTEGTADLVIWPVKENSTPKIVSIQVLPDPRKYQLLEETVNSKLGVQVTIIPIPSSGKVCISGILRDYWQAQRVLSYVISEDIPQEKIVNELTWPSLPIPVPQCRCRWCSR